MRCPQYIARKEMLRALGIEALIVVANWVFVNIDILAGPGKSSIPTATIERELRPDSVRSVIVDNPGLERSTRIRP
jgi:hypothetical protein